MRRLACLALTAAACLACSRERASPPKAAGSTDLAGTWTETFVGRPGCSDRITITPAGGTFRLFGADCNDGHAYEFEPAVVDGGVLQAQLTVPETGYVNRYSLRRAGPDELEGYSEVTGRGETNRFEVTWRRSGKSR